MVWSNDPGQINKGKGYRTVDRLDYFADVWGMDGVYLGPYGACVQQPFLLALRLILIVNRTAQYVVDGEPRFSQELCSDSYSFNRRGGLYYTDCLPNISSKVAGFD